MATHLRLRQDTTAPAVSPALQTYTHNAPATVRRQLLRADNSTITDTAYFPDGSDHSVAGDALYCQFVSDPMFAGVTFTNGDTIKMAMQCLEENGNDNLFLQLYVAVVDSAGTTVQATLRSKVLDGVELASPGATLTNRFLSTTQDGANYTTVADDRLVVEISVSGTPGTGAGRQARLSAMRFEIGRASCRERL